MIPGVGNQHQRSRTAETEAERWSPSVSLADPSPLLGSWETPGVRIHCVPNVDSPGARRKMAGSG